MNNSGCDITAHSAPICLRLQKPLSINKIGTALALLSAFMNIPADIAKEILFWGNTHDSHQDVVDRICKRNCRVNKFCDLERLETFLIRNNPDAAIITIDDDYRRSFDSLVYIRRFKPAIPSLIISKYDNTELMSKALELDVFTFITEPINFSTFDRILGRVLWN